MNRNRSNFSKMPHRSLAAAISAVLAGVPLGYAQQAPGETLEEVIVTAQKRTENLQDVPVSIQALGTQKLDELHIENLDDYVKFLPGVTTVKSLGQGGNGVGTTHVYMRGVVSGQDGNHSASQPSVGTYIDEQPVTTIDGTVDVHVYDIARVEVLEGPQGTLYGASSEAGTIRIITNKPDTGGFKAGYDVGVNSINHGGVGYLAEGFVNFPLSPVAAVRLVGWDEHDGGYIDNVAGTHTDVGIVNGQRSFNTWTGLTGQLLSNAGSRKNDYNEVDTRGGRGALKLNLGDSWTVTPTVMAQTIDAKGYFGYDPAVGDLKVVHFGPENTHDSFTQSALTIEGKVSDFDIVYAGAYMHRNGNSIADYSDYSYFYDKNSNSGANWIDNAGNPVEPQQQVIDKSRYVKWSHELRVSTPQAYPVKGTLGVFADRNLHDIYQQYIIPGLNGDGFADNLSVPGFKNTIYLADLQRVDRDQALFGQFTWDIDPSWSATAGIRFYKAKNSIQGYYGFSEGYEIKTGYFSGMLNCGPGNGVTAGTRDANHVWTVNDPALLSYQPFNGAPCTNLNQTVSESGHTERLNLSYKFDKDRMVYATYSTGFRPGGINRVYADQIKAIFPPYKPDILKNYELGWKTQWLNHRLRWNGALFHEKWNDFQFAYLGPNSITVVQNAASARINGLETDLEFALGGGWAISGSATYLDAKLTSNFCGTFVPGTVTPATDCADPPAPSGATLPVAPKLKANAVLRYSFPLASWDANVQGAYVYQASSAPLLRTADRQALGDNPSFSLLDLSGGVEKNGMSIQLIVNNVLDKRAQLSRFASCTPTVCAQNYVIPAQPRTIGLKFGQKF